MVLLAAPLAKCLDDAEGQYCSLEPERYFFPRPQSRTTKEDDLQYVRVIAAFFSTGEQQASESSSLAVMDSLSRRFFQAFRRTSAAAAAVR